MIIIIYSMIGSNLSLAILNRLTPIVLGFSALLAISSRLLAQTSSPTTLRAVAMVPPLNGYSPSSGIIEGSDGNFYGTTKSGGQNRAGTVFKMTPSGCISTLASFDDPSGEASLIFAKDGNIYTTIQGDDDAGDSLIGGVGGDLMHTKDGVSYDSALEVNGDGEYEYSALFKVGLDGTITHLVGFDEDDSQQGYITRNGDHSLHLLQARDGTLYITAFGDQTDDGSIFRSTLSGTCTRVVSFNNASGMHPGAELIEDTDGNFFGTTVTGGTSHKGTVFKLTPSGSVINLVNFGGSNGALPFGRLVEDQRGNLYGTTNRGGSVDQGTVFKLAPSGTITTLADFTGPNGSGPKGGLVQDADGNLYGTTEYGGSSDKGTIFKLSPSGSASILVNFNGLNGANPKFNLIQAKDRNFYGITSRGGDSDGGTVFKVTPTGSFTTMVSFIGFNGAKPKGGLILASDGNFYGTTKDSRTGSFYERSEGTIFRMTPSGTLNTLANFSGSVGENPTGGENPEASLVEGSDGNFYGTTRSGGSYNEGTIFKITPSGILSTLVNFNGYNGLRSTSGLVQGTDGNFYGTTYLGGSSGRGDGTVFMLTRDGSVKILVNFTGDNGKYPFGGLICSHDGTFYGTTYGDESDKGSVFQVTPSGSLTTLFKFDGATGAHPYAGVIQANDGNFYGTTERGGRSDKGTVFKLMPSGKLITLVSFTGANGRYPDASLIQASDGNFYGTTYGDKSDAGGMFQMTPSGALTTCFKIDAASAIIHPHASLIQTKDGNFFGTAEGNDSNSQGCVFIYNPSKSATVVFSSPTSGTTTASYFSISGMSLTLDLRYAPAPGDVLTVLNNTGDNFIDGHYSNLPDGGTITATFNGTTYTFIANYKGGPREGRVSGCSLTLTCGNNAQAK